MASFNRTIIVGHLTRDPQLKYLPSQTAVVDGGIACNRKYKTASGEAREEVLFIDWVCFGKAGEVIKKFALKGDPILFEGRLKLDEWEDKNGGGQRQNISLIVENFQFLRTRNSGDGTTQSPTDTRNLKHEASTRHVEPPDLSKQEFDPSDLPF